MAEATIRYLPLETLDSIIDLLHDEPVTLAECYLVSKSWVPRTRKHLFSSIEFLTVKDIHSWNKSFPDPSKSPAYHAHTLFVCWTQDFTEADARAGGLIQTFLHVVRLRLILPMVGNSLRVTPSALRNIPSTPFYKFSPTLKLLYVSFAFLPYPWILDLVRSSPLRGPDHIRPQSTV